MEKTIGPRIVAGASIVYAGWLFFVAFVGLALALDGRTFQEAHRTDDVRFPIVLMTLSTSVAIASFLVVFKKYRAQKPLSLLLLLLTGFLASELILNLLVGRAAGPLLRFFAPWLLIGIVLVVRSKIFAIIKKEV